MERRLGPTEHDADTRELPLAPCAVRSRADLQPVVGRGVRGVDQLVALLRRPRRELEQRPGAVEEVDGELPLLFGRH